ncbi:MAG: YcnI family protein [Alphaproteobacteria bacterium]
MTHPVSRAARVAPWIGAAIAATALVLAPGARAHATLEAATAVAGTYHKLVLRVPHGCDGTPTTAVSITLPDGVTGAKPQPKAGWELKVRQEKLAEPFRDAHGNVVADRPAEVTWSGGRLDDAFYDEFVVQVRLPNRPGETLHFPSVQICEKGEHRWVEIPAAGQRPGALRAPAPTLLLLPPRL